MQKQQQIVIVGGGVAGIEIATGLGRRWRRWPGDPQVILVDNDTAHVWKPMLHTIAAGTRDVSQQQTTYLAQARDAGFRYVPGELRGLDRSAREIELAAIHAADGRVLMPARRLGYDRLILAVGSQTNDFRTPGVAAHCFRIDSRRLAIAFNQEVRIRMLQSMARQAPLSIAIVGGGATGVELAAELVQLAQAADAFGIEGLATRMSITLIEAGPRLLPAFPEDISAATGARLHRLDVRVMLNTRVKAATADGLVLDNGTLPASLKVWAAGVKAPNLLADLDGLEVNANNQLRILGNLQTTRDASIHAVGDCACLALEGRVLPPTAQVAHQQARHLIRTLPSILAGKRAPDFRYRDFGALVSLGDYDAFGSLGQFGFFKGGTIRGRLAQFSHTLLYRSHQARLHGFWRGGLRWWVDRLNARLRAPIRLD